MTMTDKEFLDKLEQCPELKNRFMEILTLSTNTGKELITLADEAELQVINQMRQLGTEALQNWASNEALRVSNNIKAQKNNVRKHVKKNSGGIPHMEK